LTGKAVQIDAPCLNCGESMKIVVRDGIIENETPIGIHGYIDIPLRQWAKKVAFHMKPHPSLPVGRS